MGMVPIAGPNTQIWKNTQTLPDRLMFNQHSDNYWEWLIYMQEGSRPYECYQATPATRCLCQQQFKFCPLCPNLICWKKKLSAKKLQIMVDSYLGPKGMSNQEVNNRWSGNFSNERLVQNQEQSAFWEEKKHFSHYQERENHFPVVKRGFWDYFSYILGVCLVFKSGLRFLSFVRVRKRLL